MEYCLALSCCVLCCFDQSCAVDPVSHCIGLVDQRDVPQLKMACISSSCATFSVLLYGHFHNLSEPIKVLVFVIGHRITQHQAREASHSTDRNNKCILLSGPWPPCCSAGEVCD